MRIDSPSTLRKRGINMHGRTLHTIVIGAGPGGYTAAFEAAKRGSSVTIVDRDRPGGTCLQHGCVPVEVLARSAELFSVVRDAGRYGIACPEPVVEYERIIERKNDIVKVNENGLVRLFASHDIKHVAGTARIVSPNTVEINGSVFEADRIVCAQGSRTLALPGITIDQETILDCEGALTATSLPKSVVILGGGVIGCEFSSLYRAYGVEVTIIEKCRCLLPLWDADVSSSVSQTLKRRGVDIRTGVSVTGVSPAYDNKGVMVTDESGTVNEADICLLALGRVPAVEDTGVSDIGMMIDPRSGGIFVDRWQETSIPSIYAVGDVTGGMMLAHVAEAEAEVAVKHMFGENPKPVDYRAVPQSCRVMPAAASAGLTEREAESLESGEYEIAKIPFRTNSAAHAYGDPSGFVKVIAEKESGVVAGVHIVGHNASELIAECSVIIRNRLTVHDIASTVHAHPTMSETLRSAMKELSDRVHSVSYTHLRAHET